MARVSSGRYPALVKVPFTGAGSIIADAALVSDGVTQGTNMGLFIQAPASGLNCVGILKGASVVASDSVQAGTTYTFADVELIDSLNLLEMEYDLTVTIATTSVSGTTVTPAGTLENNVDGLWLYAVGGTGAGKIFYCPQATGGTATTMTASGWDSTTTLVKILRVGHRLAFLNSAATKLSTQAAVGTLTCYIFENYIYAPALGIEKQLLNPVLHNGLQLIPTGSPLRPVFSTRLALRSNAGR